MPIGDASNPEATLEKLEESATTFKHEREPCGCVIKDINYPEITSDKPNAEQEQLMTESTTKPNSEVQSAPAQLNEAVVQVQATPSSNTVSTTAVPTPTVTTTVATNTAPTAPTLDIEKMKNELNETANKELAKVISDIKTTWTPKSELNESIQVTAMERDFTDEEAQKILQKLDDNGYVKLKIDKEDFIKNHTRGISKDGRLNEAVSTSGTIPGIALDSEVVVLKNGKTELSVRQWGKFKAIPTGQNTARFYKISVPDAGAITESPTTDITATTHTLTSVDVTTAVRGWRQNIRRSQFEDYPAEFLNAIKETARIEAIRDEHRLIVQDLAASDHQYGGYTATGVLAFHVSGSDGAAITTGTLEDAATEFDEDGISFAKRMIQTGHDPTIGPNALVAFLSPRAFESLYTASTLSNYTQLGNPTITRLGQLETIYGVDIIVTNELSTANNAFRNLVCVKGKAWALASQRDINIQLQDIIKGQTTDVVWTHRIGVDVIDNKAYVIVSSQSN